MTDKTSHAVTTRINFPDLVLDLAARYSIEPLRFIEVLKSTILKDAAGVSNEELLGFLTVARQHNLNPWTRQIYGFRGKSGRVEPIVGVDGWFALVSAHKKSNGFIFTENNDVAGNLLSVTCTMWRKDYAQPVVVTEYFSECNRPTMDTWKQWPRRMLRHKAFIQAARATFGFPFADPDDAERQYDVDRSPMHDVTPTISTADLGTKMKEAARRRKRAEPPQEITGNGGDAAADASPQSAVEQVQEDEPGPVAGSEPEAVVPPDPATLDLLTEQDKRRLRQLHQGLEKNTNHKRAQDTYVRWQEMVGTLSSAMYDAAQVVYGAHVARISGASSPADADAQVEALL